MNTGANEWTPCPTNSGTLYFHSERDGGFYKGDIFKANLVNGKYIVEKLPYPINTANHEGDVFVAPDESYMIFQRDTTGIPYKNLDFWVSFRKEDGTWSFPKNLGSPINTIENEFGPCISPDGKYFFFCRKDDIYWVDSEIIFDLKDNPKGK